MSVILYSKEELVAMLASSWYFGSVGSSDGKRRIANFAEVGNRIAAANSSAFSATYGEATDEIVITPHDVEIALVRKTVQTMSEGFRTLRGIRYNLIANNGADFADAEILDDLLSLFAANLDRISARTAA